MKILLKLSLALLMLVSFAQVSFAQDIELESEVGEEFFEDGTETRGCKRVKCLVVCGSASVGSTLSVSGNETVGGNLAVAGAVTGGSFALSPAAPAGTPGVPGIGGMLAWGEVSNTTGGVTVGAGAIPMNNAGASFSGIVQGTGVAGVSGLTLTSAGVYLFQYSAVNVIPAVDATVVTTINLISSLGTSPVPFSQFSISNTNTAAAGIAQIVEVSGFVIALMPAGAFVQLNTTTGLTTNAAANVGAKLAAIRLA